MRSRALGWIIAVTMTAGAVPVSRGEAAGSLADLTRLLDEADRTAVVTRLGQALAHPDPRWRATAARLINVLNVTELRDVLRGVSEAETDSPAGREEVRALAALSGTVNDERASVAGGFPSRGHTLANLPAGLASAVLESHGCRMPAKPAVGIAKVSYDGVGRSSRIDLVDLPFTKECRNAAMVLLRLGLAPDGSPEDSREAHTLFVPLGEDLEERFDEFVPGFDLLEPNPGNPGPKRKDFVGPQFPPGKHGKAGQVVIDMIVDRRGVPGNFTIVRSGGDDFDREAVLAVSKWRYDPWATPVHMTVIINWQANE